MSTSILRSPKALVASLGLCVLTAAAAVTLAVPGGDSNGRWIHTSELECADSSLFCVVWEFASGETETIPCCVTATQLSYNIPRNLPCDDEFREEE